VADDSQITPMCDGDWLNTQFYHNRLYRIVGGPDGFLREDVPNYPEFSGGGPPDFVGDDRGSWFGYGVVSVDGILYSVISKTPRPGWSGPFLGIKMLKSEDNGKTWYRVDRDGNERKIAPQDNARPERCSGDRVFLGSMPLLHQ